MYTGYLCMRTAGNWVIYPTDARIEDVSQQNQFIMLTAYFELCDGDSPESDMARDLLYHEMPVHFVWGGAFGLRYR
ncbi:hypothetical protein GN958_ATG20321 [Phytophthora infestans]|nr:hypothetical protein GN958_ATG20321 [Phytophthora infestans]